MNRGLSDSGSVYIQSGGIGSVICVADINLGEDVNAYYTITPPTKTETKYKDVQREKQVTAYRPVTKYKTEQQCS